MNRNLLLIALTASLTTACGDPVERAAVGGEISRAHFIDAVTGRCVRVETTALADKSWAKMTLDPDADCKRAKP